MCIPDTIYAIETQYTITQENGPRTMVTHSFSEDNTWMNVACMY